MGLDQITVNTGLEEFVFPDSIIEIDKKIIKSSVAFKKDSMFLGLEALAQTAATHVRYLCNFNKHAFLLKVDRFNSFKELIPDINYIIESEIVTETDSAFSCRVTLKRDGDASEPDVSNGKIIIAVKPYDQFFKKDILKENYKKRFKRLMSISLD